MKQNNFLNRFAVVIAIITCIIFVVPGCKKILDTEAQGSYNADNYPYPGGSGPYDQYIFAAYNELRQFNVHVFPFIHATSIRSDDADKGSTAADGGANSIDMDNFKVLPGNGFTNDLWTGYFGLINKCNVTIKQVNTNTTIVASDAIKNQTIGEAKFLRGYAYFMMVRLFGRVPLIDSVFSNPASQNNVAQSSPAQLYAFIESDLSFAASILPASWDAKFVGRATSGAANGLLAKVYLTQQKWASAMAAANLVITSGKYDLSTPYDRIFREEGENSKESVFEVQATATATVPTDNGIQYTNVQGVRGSGVWDLGWGFNSPSQNLADFYEANDPRRARTILFTSTATQTYQTIYGETLPVGLPNPRYNNKVYSNPSLRASVGNRFGWWMNVRILRYADVVLMYAEAANEVGGAANITAAQNALNSIRARARAGAPAGTLPDVVTTDQATLRDAIRRERRAELAMEHDRFFDLVRWGIAQTTLHAVGKTNFSDSRDVILPIPQVQMDLSAGVLTQNFGY
ncbi:MAG: RagB/SusD family nutrient uptake outer membrane protein [Bacteroidetes bacterium]|nr:MAG: RagB/SusD family nutrient uptake outer membrane protein [Bacteroidota bacterium]